MPKFGFVFGQLAERSLWHKISLFLFYKRGVDTDSVFMFFSSSTKRKKNPLRKLASFALCTSVQHVRQSYFSSTSKSTQQAFGHSVWARWWVVPIHWLSCWPYFKFTNEALYATRLFLAGLSASLLCPGRYPALNDQSCLHIIAFSSACKLKTDGLYVSNYLFIHRHAFSSTENKAEQRIVWNCKHVGESHNEWESSLCAPADSAFCQGWPRVPVHRGNCSTFTPHIVLRG